MESTSASSSHRPATHSMPVHHDVEAGYIECLRVNDVTSTLEDRKIELIQSPCDKLCRYSIRGLILGFGVGGPAAVLYFSAFGIYCLADLKNDDCSPLNVAGVPFFLGIGLFLLISVYYSLLGALRGCVRMQENRKRTRHNELLDGHLHQLSFYDNSDTPVRACDFIDMFSEKFLEENDYQKLSFQQLREIKSLKEDVFNWLVEEKRMGMNKYAPWRKLELLRKGTLGDFTDALSDDYLSQQIHARPGFFEELIKILPKNILNDTEASAALIQNIQNYLCIRFEMEFTKEEVREQMAQLFNGGVIENCFRMIKSDEQKLEITCGSRKVVIPHTVLKECSEYFKALFDFHKELPNYEIHDLTEEQFEVLITSIRGKQLIINQDNVEDYLEIANYFQLKSLAKDCELPLTLKYSRQRLEVRLKLIEKYPIISGCFAEYVDRDFRDQLKFKNILKEKMEFLRCYRLTKDLRLDKSKAQLINLLTNEIKTWKKSQALKADLDTLIESVNRYGSFIPTKKSLQSLLIKAIQVRLKNESDLSIIYKKVIERPSTLFIKALYLYLNNKDNRDHGEASFISLSKTKSILLEEMKKLTEDSQLLKEIQEWKQSSLYVESMREFLLEIYN
ncbi:MAG: hypothetical protein K940chlam3_01011, partial [Chlamydiae bacterium]|nr:hypothetical protein [Chlamydiota bacterium]